MHLDQIFQLSSGESLGYLEMGHPTGPACFFFHGFPGSSQQVLLINHHELLEKFRVIAVDRPGFGDSSFRRNRKNIEIASIHQELADHLGLQKFHLIAVSGGGPAAFIVADRLRSRVLSLTTICGLGPVFEPDFFGDLSSVSQFLLKLGRRSPLLAAWGLRRIRVQMQKQQGPDPRFLAKWFPKKDLEVIMDPQVRVHFQRSMAHAFKQGAWGPAIELSVFQQDWQIKDWNFPFQVRLWHGSLDRIVPPKHSQRLAARIPGAELHLLEQEAHYSLPVYRIGEILAALQTDV